MALFKLNLMGSLAVLCAISMVSPGVAATANITVPGNANPYLSGLPDGTPAISGDMAPDESPVEVTGIDIFDGAVLFFLATGQVSLGASLGPDPDGGALISHSGGAENGFSAVTMPSVSLLGVFLDAESPDASAAPDGLSFSTVDSRNYATLSPQLKQIFFIGDGLTDAGDAQSIVAPTGATRLFLGTMDGYGWYNNSGAFQVTINGEGGTVLPPPPVPLPASLPLLAVGIAMVAGLARRRA